MKAEVIESLCAGTELDIVNAARISMNTEHTEFTDGDAKLIRYLWTQKHTPPFRHAQLSFRCTAPVFVARQLGKSQIGMSWSEVSRRYRVHDGEFWRPTQWREAPENAKQGTGEPIEGGSATHGYASHLLDEAYERAFANYQRMLTLGIAPEQARAILPQGAIIKWTWTGSLLAWLHLIRERSHPSVQTETREWVWDWIVPVVKERFPVTWEAFEKTLP